MYPIGQAETGAVLTNTIAHEVFHCFQGALSDDLADFYSSELAPWVVEGEATWVGATISGDDSMPWAWSSWLLKPKKSLLSRVYSAVGIYSLLTDSGGDTWAYLDSIYQAAIDEGSTDAYQVLAAAGGDSILDEVGA